MLINATRPAEVRAAILDDGKLDQLEIEVRDANLLKGNIYKGRIANVEGSLGACFVEFGADKQGFLPMDEVAPSCYHRKWDKKERPRINDVLQRGREVLVQVVKDAVGNKGAALTTRISLAGRYIVLMPLDDSRGVSRKVSSDSQRKKIKELASKLKIPEDYGFIVRTAGLDRTRTDLNRDAAQLVRTWKNILALDEEGKGPALLHEDRDLVVRMLRDYYDSKIERILIDDEIAVTKAQAYFRRVMPRSKQVLQPYTHKVPMFARYRVEEQIEEIFSRRAGLKSGGYILIDPTEALISIDVNSGRSTKQKSQEETALHTNLEAAREVARQLRLRDLGGLIVIDFIDMPTRSANRQVEKVLKDALKDDKARTYVGKISDNGLLEVNRQRLKQALQSQTHRACPTCDGRGVIPAAAFVARKLLRTLEAKAAGGSYAKVIVRLHPELADHVQNTHRRELVDLEERFGLLLGVEGRPGMHRGEQEIRWSNLDKLTEAERRQVDDRRKAMVEANKSLARRRAEAEAEAAALDLEEAELEEFEADELEDEEQEREQPRISRSRDDDEDDEDGDEEFDRGDPARPGRRSRRGRGRSRARGRGRGRDHVDSSEAAPDDPADEQSGDEAPPRAAGGRRDQTSARRGQERSESRRRGQDKTDSGGRGQGKTESGRRGQGKAGSRRRGQEESDTGRRGRDDSNSATRDRDDSNGEERERSRPEASRRAPQEVSTAEQSREKTETDTHGDEFDPEAEENLSRSQKRRLRRKRKRARERDDDGVEGAAGGDDSADDETDDRPKRATAVPARAARAARPTGPAVEPEAETILDPMVAPIAAEPDSEEAPPGESLAPPASDGVFSSLKRYLGLGSGRGSSDTSAS